MSGSFVSSCCRSPSITATYCAEDESAPSITAEARPRRPMRRMQRTRGSVWAMRRTSAAVPSGLLSSTYTTSQAMPYRAASSLAISGATLGRSL